MAYSGDLLNWMNRSLKQGPNDFRSEYLKQLMGQGSNYLEKSREALGDMGLLGGKEGLTSSLRTGMGRNDMTTDARNAWIGAQAPQPNEMMQFGDTSPMLPKTMDVMGQPFTGPGIDTARYMDQAGGNTALEQLISSDLNRDASRYLTPDFLENLKGRGGQIAGTMGGTALGQLLGGMAGAPRLGGQLGNVGAQVGMEALKGFPNPENILAAGAEPVGSAIGGAFGAPRLGGKLAGTAATGALAAAQGFANPVSDIAFLMSLFRMFG